MQIAQTLGHSGLNPEHMFLAFLSSQTNRLVEQIADDYKIDMNAMRMQLTSELDKYILPEPPNIGE